MDSDSQQLYVALNMEHPANIQMAEFMDNATEEQMDLFVKCSLRRLAFNDCRKLMPDMDSVTARCLVRMFRAGFGAGHIVGFGKGERGIEDG